MKRKRLIITRKEELDNLIRLFDWSLFAFDTETTSTNYYDQEIVCITLADNNYEVMIPFHKTSIPRNELINSLKKVMTRKKNSNPKLVIAHNIIFDYKMLRKIGINLYNNEWFDTMVADHLLNENRNHRLKYLTTIILKRKVVTYQEMINGYNSILDVPINKLTDYAIADAVNAYDLAMIQKEQLKSEGLIRLFRKIEMPSLRAIAEMEMNGVLINKEELERSKIILANKIIELEEELYNILGEPYTIQKELFGRDIKIVGKYNFNSSQDLKKILFDNLKLPIISNTPSGEPSTGKETLNALADKSDFVKKLLEYRAAQKLYTSFVTTLLELINPDGRVRTQFRDTGTVTGRLSSNNPNLQQLPKGEVFGVNIRKCFVASPGEKMVAIDFSQQELRIMAEITRDPILIKSIKEGMDLHLYTANKVFKLGIPEEYLYESHPEYSDIKKKFKSYRDKGKAFSFGIPYGMSYVSLAKRLGVSEDEAKELLRTYFEEFPMIKKAIDEVHKQAEEQGFVTSLAGRKRRFTRDSNGKLDFKSLRQSFNFLIQGFAADILRVALIKILNYKYSHKEYNINLLFTVHDEVVLECDEEYAEVVAKDLEELFGSITNMVVPLTAEASTGYDYDEAK